MVDPTSTEQIREDAWNNGYRAACLLFVREALKHLDADEILSPGRAVNWMVEREEAIQVLRRICNEYGDNEWEPTLHLADIIDKHLADRLNFDSRKHERIATWLKKAHEVADGFLDKPSESHIVDKICAIGWERDRLRKGETGIVTLMKDAAKGLLDDPPGTNPKYERALCELIARVAYCVGLAPNTGEAAREVGKEIGASWK